jgi:hypothetical protein
MSPERRAIAGDPVTATADAMTSNLRTKTLNFTPQLLKHAVMRQQTPNSFAVQRPRLLGVTATTLVRPRLVSNRKWVLVT